MSDVWTANVTSVPEGQLVRIAKRGEPMSFEQMFDLLASKPQFAHGYANTLAASPFEAFFFPLGLQWPACS